MKILIFIALLITSAFSYAGNIAREGHYIFDSEKKLIKHIKTQKDLIIDHVGEYGYEVYGPEGLSLWLKTLGADFKNLNSFKENKLWGRGNWPKFKAVEKQIRKLVATYPTILELVEIGKSEKGNNLLFVKISDNVKTDEAEPEFKYVANMHGDEIVGRELMLKLIEDLAKNYGKDQRITDLINNSEIYIMPTLNPDGSDSQRRSNSKWVDLNRDFPDFTTSDSDNDHSGRASETMAMMKFQAERKFCFSANFHGGAVVVNYPWDTTHTDHPYLGMIKKFSLAYSVENSPMYNSRSYENGIVNGYQWYEVNGGMQDWSYYYHDDLQVTVELSDTKWPKYKEVDGFYKDNRESLLTYMEFVHQGAGFSSKDMEAGLVEIVDTKGLNHGEFTFSRGEFYKVLPVGEYIFKIKARGRDIVEKLFQVTQGDVKNHILEI